MRNPHRSLRVAVVALVSLLVLQLSLQGQVVISELLAANATGLRDEDGATSDWIELHNPTVVAVSLEGWFLSDSRTFLAKWRLPATVLDPGGRLIVFASGKNRGLSGGPLHTNFRLDAEGGFLALVRPDGLTVASQLDYPRQFPDVSFGPGLGPSRNALPLVGSGASIAYLIPTAEVAPTWRGGDAFDDSAWRRGSWPAGFDTGEGATVVALRSPAHTPGNQAFGGSLGMDFQVLHPIQVTALGCFDDLANGIAPGTTITVELWRRHDQGTPGSPFDDTGLEVVARTNFTSAAAGERVEGSLFKMLPVPVLLTNGAYTIVAFGYGTAERNGNAAADGFPRPVIEPGEQDLEFVRSRWGEAGQFPGVVDVMAAQYGAGTFQFRPGPSGAFATSLQAMHRTNATVLVRIPFTVAAPSDFANLTLRVRYDDGFVAWLNGVELARRNAPATLSFEAAATAVAAAVESLDVSHSLTALRPGTNVLALQGLNAGADDPDFALEATLAAEGTRPSLVFFASPSPGRVNPPGLLFPHPLINEIHSDPPDAKTAPAEFIELFNPGRDPVDLAGWSFTQGIHFTFPPGTTLAPGGYLVLAENPTVLQRQFGVSALGPWSGSLDNAGEVLELADAGGAPADRVNYGLGFPWPTVGSDAGHSMQLLNEGLDHNLGGSWRSAPPTPGARNIVTSGQAPPHIRQVAHAPLQPASGQIVRITAKVTDPEGVQEVSLEYQIVEPGAYVGLTEPGYAEHWIALPMRDDGQAGDELAGDALYSALVPAPVQVHRRLIRYRLVARDAEGNQIRAPYADDPVPNFAWFVYDGVPAWTGAVQPGVTPPATFGTNVMRQVRAFHLLARQEDVLNCQYNPAFNDTLYRFEGTLVADGAVHDHIRFRVAGQNSTYITGKNKWKFRFPRGHELTLMDDRGQPVGTTRQTLKVSGLSEPWAAWNRGLAGLDEAVANRLYNLAGVPAPRTVYFQLRVIDEASEAGLASQYDGDLWGLYLGFEEYDESFKDSHGLPDGNLFLLQGGNHRLGAQGAGQPTDFSDLQAFMAGYQASPTAPLAWWRTHVDLPRYYAWRAVTEAINNTDIRDGENVAYFRNPTNELWSIHPWDSDLLYEQFDRWGPEGVQNASPYEQIRRCLQVPALQVEFQNRARELQDLLLNREQIGMLIDELMSVITAGGPADPGFVEVDRRLWDWHPRTATDGRSAWEKGSFYRTPFPVPSMGNGPFNYSRVLASPDFAGQVAWVKDFIVADPHGGGRLAALAHDPTIPVTPVISYAGPTGFPADGLVFRSTPFQSPARRGWAARQWRLAEVDEPGGPPDQPGAPHRYEIEAGWDSGAVREPASQIAVPGPWPQEGRTYRARVRDQDETGRWSHWSAPFAFTAGAPLAGDRARGLIVSEIMCDPPEVAGVDGDAFEFLELKNTGATTLDLGGLSFTKGLSFTFPVGTVLAPGAYFLLVRDPVRFSDLHPGVTFQGVYTGRLDNDGETLTLSHPDGAVVFTFAYATAAPWPTDVRGSGRSLVRANESPGSDPANPILWRASWAAGGSPGTVDAAMTTAPEIELQLHPGLVIQGQVQAHYRVEYREPDDPADTWKLLLDLPSLPAPVWTVYDPQPVREPRRSYRVLLVP